MKKVFDNARIIIYRCHAKGLEVLLIKNTMDSDPDIWAWPQGSIEPDENDFIELESRMDNNGNKIETIAIEADWHEIPSIRGIIKHDVKRLKSKIKQAIPSLESCSYMQVKKVIKEVLPHEYESIKELKDIIVDRNLLKSI